MFPEAVTTDATVTDGWTSTNLSFISATSTMMFAMRSVTPDFSRNILAVGYESWKPRSVTIRTSMSRIISRLQAVPW
jgi:hypothetical protein